MLNELESIKSKAQQESQNAGSVQEVQQLKVKYLGKKGLLTLKIKSLGSIPKDERRECGRILNETKQYIEDLLDNKAKVLKSSELDNTLQTEQIDLTFPGCFTLSWTSAMRTIPRLTATRATITSG